MTTDTERREVARSMREMAKGKFDFCARNIALEIGMDDPSDFDECFDDEHLEAWGRLADLIYQGDMSQGRRDIVACDRDALLALADEMDTHWLGHEGMEDSPVARWARELREALAERGE